MLQRVRLELVVLEPAADGHDDMIAIVRDAIEQAGDSQGRIVMRYVVQAR